MSAHNDQLGRHGTGELAFISTVPVHRTEAARPATQPTSPGGGINRTRAPSVAGPATVASAMSLAIEEHQQMSCVSMGTKDTWKRLKGVVKRLPVVNYFFYAFWQGPTLEGAEALVNTFILVSSLMLTIAISLPFSLELGELDIADERFRGIGYRHNRDGKQVFNVPIGRYGCATRGVDNISILLLERFWLSLCLLGAALVISMVMVVSLNTLKKGKFYNAKLYGVDLFGDTVDAPLHAGLHTGGADDVDDGDDDENAGVGKLRVTGGRQRFAGRMAEKDRAIAKVFEDWWWFMWFPMLGDFLIIIAAICTFIQATWTLVTIKFPHPYVQQVCKEYGWIPIPPTDIQIEMGTEQYVNGTFLSHNQILFGFDGSKTRVDFYLVNAGLLTVPLMMVTTILLGYAARTIDKAAKRMLKAAQAKHEAIITNDAFVAQTTPQSKALNAFLLAAKCSNLRPLFDEHGITLADLQGEDDQYIGAVLVEIGVARVGDRMRLIKAKRAIPVQQQA